MNKQFLSQEDAEKLLALLKDTLVDNITFPQKGETEKFEVCSKNTNDVFCIQIYRGRIKTTKYNINALIEKNGILLLELHIGETLKHVNPDGSIIEGSHWHVYSEQYDRRQAYIAENLNSDDFVGNTILFLDRFNVIKKPNIYVQEAIGLE